MGSCDGECFGCGGNCSGCSGGCYGCSGCGGCDGSCSNTCQGICTGNGATVSINGVNKTAKFYVGISNVVKQSSNQYFAINGVIKTPK